ncbi:MAG: branched-chain amino acid ABC transporter ATP-binding protein/permease [Actinomycetia bacterium]|nr:branched-chain amino acid ABC transporter ATP-binding protein/permease [Actinomycetes bacterium]
MFPDLRRDVGLPIVSSLALFGLLAGAGLLFAAIQGGSAANQLVTAMLIDAIMVVGLQIYIGNTGVFSFGHIGFGAIAGYTFALFAIDPTDKATRIANAPWGLVDVSTSPLVATVIAVAVTLVIAVIVGIGLARSGARSGSVAATVITLALLFVTHEVARSWTDVTGGDRAGLTFGIGDTLGSRWPIVGVLVIAIIGSRLFAQSRTGRLAKATREDNLAARAMGINPTVQQTAALLISVAVVAVAASLRVHEVGSVLPGLFFFDYTLLTLVMLVVGGRNSVSGAILGVGVITLVRELARRLGSDGFELFGIGLDGAPLDWIFREGLPRVVLGLAMVGFMIWRPDGLIEDWELDNWIGRKLRRGDDESIPETPAPADGVAPAELSATDVVVDFGGFRALNQVDIRAAGNEIVGLIGPNGAGKTTLVNVITGLVEQTEGTIALDETDLSQAPSHEIARAGLVRTFQNLRLFSSLTVRENVEIAALVADVHRSERARIEVDALVAAADLWPHRDRRAAELDYGNSRRLELARAAALRPTFLLLDEPTSGMSDAESLEMVEQVRNMAAIVGAGVVVIDHDLNFITGICDRIYCLDQGRPIAEGTPAEIQADPHVQAAYLGSAALT